MAVAPRAPAGSLSNQHHSSIHKMTFLRFNANSWDSTDSDIFLDFHTEPEASPEYWAGTHSISLPVTL
jgi:hypothetical protein